MICALKSAGMSNTDYQTFTIPNSSEHSFNYCYSWDGLESEPSLTIASHVIPFLDAHLK